MIKGEYDPKEHAKLLYEMDLHETIKFSQKLYVTRVPDGWFYDRINDIGRMSSVFIPYNEEFKIHEKPITAQEILTCNEVSNCHRDY